MSEPLTIEAHGVEYRINDPGGVIGDALRTGRPYEGPLLERIYDMDFDGFAIDVGANVGNHTLWFALVCKLQVVAFEPLVPGRLAENLALNDLNGRVRAQPVALGAAPGKAVSIGKGRLRPAPFNEHHEQDTVNVCRLDDLGFHDVALIKIDVEGMEPDVLMGALETIGEWRPFLYVEAADGAAHRKLQTILRPLNYEHTQTFGATPLEEWTPF